MTDSTAPPTSRDGLVPDPDPDEDNGHHPSIAQPHGPQEGPVFEAETAAAEMSTEESPLGRPGRPINRRSPFMIGIAATLGAVVTVALVEVVITARDVLVLIGLALFLAVGLEPAVSRLVRFRFPRWTAVLTVIVALLAVVGGFLAAAVPPLVTQTTAFVEQVPTYITQLTDNHTFIGQLNSQFHIEEAVQSAVTSGGSVFSGVLGAGVVVLSTLASTLVVAVLTVYFLGALPTLRAGLYRLVPNSRRPRAILLGDEIAARVGGYVLGSLTVALIAGVLTFIWLEIFGAPYPLLLAIMVSLLDFIPVVGSTTAGVVCCLVTLTVSGPLALATAGFFLVYRFVEDYVLVPRIIGQAVKVSALGTVLAVLLGGVLFGIIGAVVAIPFAAAIQLIVREIALPRLDRS